jgi:predicted nucleic acid-binding protein
LPTSAEPILLDTSAAIALLSSKNLHNPSVRERTSGHRLGLAGHASYETYSVLTRLPVPLRLIAADAARVLDANFPATHHLSEKAAAGLMARFATTGITGGAVYDGLVAAAALDAGLILVSCDQRAAGAYAALGARFELVR